MTVRVVLVMAIRPQKARVIKHVRFGCTMAGVSRPSTGFDAYRWPAETYIRRACPGCIAHNKCKQIK